MVQVLGEAHAAGTRGPNHERLRQFGSVGAGRSLENGHALVVQESRPRRWSCGELRPSGLQEDAGGEKGGVGLVRIPQEDQGRPGRVEECWVVVVGESVLTVTQRLGERSGHPVQPRLGHPSGCGDPQDALRHVGGAARQSFRHSTSGVPDRWFERRAQVKKRSLSRFR